MVPVSLCMPSLRTSNITRFAKWADPHRRPTTFRSVLLVPDPGLKPISANLKRDESFCPGGTEMIVARQFIAWNVSKEATRPVGNGVIGSDRRATIRTINQLG